MVSFMSPIMRSIPKPDEGLPFPSDVELIHGDFICLPMPYPYANLSHEVVDCTIQFSLIVVSFPCHSQGFAQHARFSIQIKSSCKFEKENRNYAALCC